MSGVCCSMGKPERGTDDPGDSKRGSQESGRVYADSERTDMGTSGERKGKDGDCTGNKDRLRQKVGHFLQPPVFIIYY